MKQNSIQTVEVPVAELITPDYNPRKHYDLAKEQLKESIRRFGIAGRRVALNLQIFVTPLGLEPKLPG